MLGEEEKVGRRYAFVGNDVVVEVPDELIPFRQSFDEVFVEPRRMMGYDDP